MFENRMKVNASVTVSMGVIIIVVMATMQLSSVLTMLNRYTIGNAYALSSVDRTHIRDALSGVLNNTEDDDSKLINAAIKDKPPKVVLQVRNVDSGQKTVPAGTTAAQIASCLPDEVATGGGHQILLAGSNTENPNVTVGSDEIPGHTPGWFITVTNPGPNDIAIRATAVCAKIVEAP